MKRIESADEVVLEPASPVRATVIWLHGLGADGFDFVPIVPELGLAAEAGVRFVFPHAPIRPVTINGGYPLRAWYDIFSLTEGSRQDEAGIRESAARVQACIEAQIAAGIPAARIVLAGFSQGGAIALHVALRGPHRLAGLIALSTYLPLHQSLRAEALATNRSLPIFLAHGQFDPIVAFKWGEDTRTELEALGYSVEWHAYPMQHQVCTEQIEDIAAWLRRVLAP